MTIQGFVDTHNHQFANLGFGGREVFGPPSGSVAASLPHCNGVHGPGGSLDPIGTFVKWQNGYPSLGHKVGGNPEFDGWPRYDSVTHQSVHKEWLERAWQGGLRVMVMLAVNNEWMTTLPGFVRAPGRTGGDMEAVRYQLAAAHALQDEIDKDCGGSGDGWYRIVTSPEQARDVAESGKLAVILGVEVDYLLDSYPTGAPLTVAAMQQGIAQLADQGVRYVFPIHFGDNQFGGTAIQNMMETSVPASVVTPLGVLPLPYIVPEENSPIYTWRKQRNVNGLTVLGKALIRELITQGMMFDIDHMSYKSRSDALDIAESCGYPVISGHTGFLDISAGQRSTERQLTGAEVDRIVALGGMVSPIAEQGALTEISTYVRPDGTSIPHRCSRSDNTLAQAYLYAVHRTGMGKVGIGTDFNGFAGLPAPTKGGEADYGKNPKDSVTPLTYPFTAPSGVSMQQSVIGKKTFDINTDGLAHVGMLPDLIAHLQAQGVTEAEIEPIMRSADDLITLWETARFAATPSVAMTPAGEACVFWRGTDGNLWQAIGDPTTGALTGPDQLGMGQLGRCQVK